MKLIFISGPSGSGKTTLSNQIKSKIKNSIVLSTDNYYKTGLKSKLLSKLIENYFDKNISFNNKLFKKDFNFILKNRISNIERTYSFKNKSITKSIKEKNNINFLIVEGIFAKEFLCTLNNKNYLLLELEINKNDCMKRILKRDLRERGKTREQAEKDFLKSWDIYYEKSKNKCLEIYLNQILINKKTNIDRLLKKFFINA